MTKIFQPTVLALYYILCSNFFNFFYFCKIFYFAQTVITNGRLHEKTWEGVRSLIHVREIRDNSNKNLEELFEGYSNNCALNDSFH